LPSRSAPSRRRRRFQAADLRPGDGTEAIVDGLLDELARYGVGLTDATQAGDEMPTIRTGA
jgi:hypothetical protein